jgi:hypothetical protein
MVFLNYEDCSITTLEYFATNSKDFSMADRALGLIPNERDYLCNRQG